tara:strand:- start:305 stop:547 length:243 start_codon:yes stop_codon:yes gene_type:complete
MVRRLTFTGLLPNWVEACSFIPSKYKSHKTFINKALHALATPVIILAFFLLNIVPEVSSSLIAGSFALQGIGHLFEGLLN